MQFVLKPSSQSGFTLIEMLIVVALIALVGSFVTTRVMRRYDESKVSAAKIQIRQLGVILDDYRRVCGRYPTTDQGLDALVKAPTIDPICKHYDPEGFLNKLPEDPWNSPYVYESDHGSKYILKSLGANGKPGGEGFDKDISSEDLD